MPPWGCVSRAALFLVMSPKATAAISKICVAALPCWTAVSPPSMPRWKMETALIQPESRQFFILCFSAPTAPPRKTTAALSSASSPTRNAPAPWKMRTAPPARKPTPWRFPSGNCPWYTQISQRQWESPSRLRTKPTLRKSIIVCCTAGPRPPTAMRLTSGRTVCLCRTHRLLGRTVSAHR